MATLASLAIRLTADTADYERALSGAATRLDTFGRSAQRFGRNMTQWVAVPILGLGAAALKASISFESAFAGVEKTVDGTKAQMDTLRTGIRDMAMELPASRESIAGVAEAAGQLGIETDNVLGFTRTMTDLGEATNMSAEEAATSLARLANITQLPQDQFDRLGSVVVDLGNNLATTESEIVSMGLRIAGAGAQIGLAEAEILGIAGALSSVGIEAEAGGSAISRVMINIASQVETSGDKLGDFAAVAGMSAEQFATAWQEDAAGALVAFIEGLGNMEAQGGSTLQTLEALGITEIRMRDALLRSAGAGDLLRESLERGNRAWEENTALTTEAEQRYQTTESQLRILWNRITDIAVTVGDALVPMLMSAVDTFEPVIRGAANLASSFADADTGVQTLIVTVGGLVAAAGPTVWIVGGIARAIGGIASVAGSAIGGIGNLITYIGVLRLEGQLLSTVMSGLLNPAVLGITAVVGGAIFAYSRWSAAKREAREASERLATALADETQSVTENTEEWVLAELRQRDSFDKIREAARLFGFDMGDVTDAIMGTRNGLVEVMETVPRFDNAMGLTDGERERRRAANLLRSELGFLGDTFAEQERVMRENRIAQMEQAGTIDATTAAMARQGLQVDDSANGPWARHIRAMRDAESATSGVRGETEGLADPLGDVAAEADEAAQKMEELAEQFSFVGEGLSSFGEPLQIYQDALADKNEAERAAYEETRKAMEDSETEIAEFVESAGLSLDEYQVALQTQTAEMLTWKENLLWVHRTLGPEVAAHFASMGSEGNRLMEEMRSGTTAKAKKMAEDITGYNQAMSDDVEQILTLSLAAQQGIVDVGTAGVVSSIATQLDIGVTEVAGIGKRYGGELGRAIEPLLMAIGDDKTRQAVRAYINGQPITGLNEGGPVPGSGPDRDSVPALLTPGEFVTRRSAVALYGPDVFEALNDRQVDPEVARRAILGLNRGGLGDVQGLNTGGLVALGRWLQSQGARVGEHPAFGGVRGRHVPGSLHYVGDAIDVNYGPGGENAIEKAFFDRIVPQIRAGLFGSFREILWRVAGHFNHLHVGGSGGGGMGGVFGVELPEVPDFPHTGILGTAPAVFGDLRDRMQAWIDEMFFPGGSGGGGTWGDLQAMAREMLHKRGWGQHWRAFDRLVQKESGWDPMAQNPTSTAFGLGQFLNSTWATVGGRKTSDPRLQLEYMMRYIAQRYGNPSAALAFHNRNNWYNEGGMVPLQVLDSGGFLPPGLSAVYNGTGKPEHVPPPMAPKGGDGIDYDRLANAIARVRPLTVNAPGPTAEEIARTVRRELRDDRIRTGSRR